MDWQRLEMRSREMTMETLQTDRTRLGPDVNWSLGSYQDCPTWGSTPTTVDPRNHRRGVAGVGLGCFMSASIFVGLSDCRIGSAEAFLGLGSVSGHGVESRSDVVFPRAGS